MAAGTNTTLSNLKTTGKPLHEKNNLATPSEICEFAFNSFFNTV
ncbi:hypothetical protein [Hymenobacter sp. APR13]|nr:hypothetical protein [Hymenobacter sp. APR13]AII51746.1 hypothetical protein N008_07090 [Hymenobacter sp. APR13]